MASRACLNCLHQGYSAGTMCNHRIHCSTKAAAGLTEVSATALPPLSQRHRGQASCDASWDTWNKFQTMMQAEEGSACHTKPCRGCTLALSKNCCAGPSEGHVQSRAHIWSLSEPVKSIPNCGAPLLTTHGCSADTAACEAL